MVDIDIQLRLKQKKKCNQFVWTVFTHKTETLSLAKKTTEKIQVSFRMIKFQLTP